MIKNWSFLRVFCVMCVLGPIAAPIAALIFISWMFELSPFGF